MHPQNPWKNVTRDLFILTVSVAITIVIADTSWFDSLLKTLTLYPTLGAFISGFFFTSVFTIAPAGLVLVSLSPIIGPLETAFIGALGAVISDTAIFLFFREKLMRDIDEAVQSATRKNPLAIFHFEFLKWLNPILGALVIISPLPDEIGLVLLGFSNISIKKLMTLLFVLNTIGILLISEIAMVFQNSI